MNITEATREQGLIFDRYLGYTLSLPFSSFNSIKIQPNDIATEPVINLALSKLYQNLIYLYKISRVASNVIPVRQIGIAGIANYQSCIAEGVRIVVAYSESEGPCPGGHLCNAATYNFYMNSIYLGEVNLNNAPGGGDRSTTFVLTQEQAEAIAAVSPTVTFGIFCNIPPNEDRGFGPGQCHPQLPWIRVFNADNELIYENCAAETEFSVGLCNTNEDDVAPFRWHTYSQGLSTSEFSPLAFGLLENLDNVDVMAVADNRPLKRFSVFMSTGGDLTIFRGDMKLTYEPIDYVTTFKQVLSSNELYQGSGVYWNKINDMCFGAENSLYIADLSGNRVVKYDATGFFSDDNVFLDKLVFKDVIGGFGGHNDRNQFNAPRSVTTFNTFLYVLDSGNRVVKKYDKDLNWVTTYRLFRDLLSAYPMHLSHDSKGNMYILTTQNSVLKYDTNFQNRITIPLDSLSATDESYKKLVFSPSDENVFYVLSDKNVYKKLLTKPDEDVGFYLPYLFRVNTFETYTTMASISSYDGAGDLNFIFSKSNDDGAGKIMLYYDDLNLFDVLASKDFDIYTFDDIKINKDEYLQNWVFNKAIAKLLINHIRFRDQITGKFLAKRDIKNNITFRGTRYFLPDELAKLRFLQNTSSFIGQNEIFQNNIVNRCLEHIYNMQVIMLEALQAEISTRYEATETVFLN